MKLRGKNAIITGASQGLGKEIARHFVAEGANIAICARDYKLLNQTAEELTNNGATVVATACDVSSKAQVDSFVHFAATSLGPIDILVNNAGIYGPKGPSESVDLEEWMRALEINLYGVLLPCRALIPSLKRTGGGKIIVLSGGGATAPLPFISAYAASKAAVVRLVETLAMELVSFGVDVNAIAPGALNTRLLDEIMLAGPETVGTEFYQRSVRQRDFGGVPLEMGARLAVYLASSESDGITGKLISAQWDTWDQLHDHIEDLKSDIFTLRRIVPRDRGKDWS